MEKTIKLYSFSELSQKVQEKLIKEEYEKSADDINDMVYTDFKEQTAEKLGSDLNVYYSLSCCQGDGVYFEGEICLDKLLANFSERFNRNELRLLKKCKDSIRVKVGHKSRYYFNSLSDIDLEIGQYSYSKDYNYIDNLEFSIEDKILKILEDFGKELENQGYNEFSEIDEFSRMTLEESENVYTENGIDSDYL